MTLTELRYIVTVSKTKHFGKAAVKCFVSQPTLSVAIRKLEDELDVEIFERGRSEVNITPIGHVIIEQAEKILLEASAIKKITEKLKGNLEEPVRLAALESIGPYIFPYIVKEFKKILPNTLVNFKLSDMNSIKSDLLDSKIDFALSSTSIINDKIETYKVYSEPLVVILPIEHHAASKDAISIEDLDNNIILVNSHNCYRNELLSIIPDLYKDNNHYQESDTIENIFNMVAMGSGVSIVPYSSIKNLSSYLNDFVKIRNFDNNSKHYKFERAIYCMWRKGFYREYVLNEFLDIFKQDNIFEQII